MFWYRVSRSGARRWWTGWPTSKGCPGPTGNRLTPPRGPAAMPDPVWVLPRAKLEGWCRERLLDHFRHGDLGPGFPSAIWQAVGPDRHEVSGSARSAARSTFVTRG